VKSLFPWKFPLLKRNQGRSQSLVSEVLSPNTNTATRPSIVAKSFFLVLHKDHGQAPMLGHMW
jgi:hypothetical protein